MVFHELGKVVVLLAALRSVHPLRHVMVACDAEAQHQAALTIEEKVNMLKFQADADRLAMARIERLVLEIGSFCLSAFSSGGIAATCDELHYDGNVHDGVYDLYVAGRRIKVFCEFSQHYDLQWLVIQRRESNRVDFYKDWHSYAVGFGNLKGDFWLGLENIHLITSSMEYQLRIELEDWEGNTAYADYDLFSVLDRSVNYKLRLTGYSGNAGDAMSYHNNHPFSTKDHDNDASLAGNCAKLFHGGWWYVGCHHANLNGYYFIGGQCDPKGISWKMWKNKHYSLKRVVMKIRPSDIAQKERWLHGYTRRERNHHHTAHPYW